MVDTPQSDTSVVGHELRCLFAPEPLPEESRAAAEDVLLDGRLFRYDYQEPSRSPVSLLEKDFAHVLGCRYALAVNSCGSAMHLAILCAGAQPGDRILVPAFTFTAVLGAIVNCGCKPVLVDIADDYCVDIDDLKHKYRSDIRFFLLSYMRGRVARLDSLFNFCASHHVTIIEDCAHSLGTSWRDRSTGTFGAVSCFSFHDKLLSSGEGGMLVTDDDQLLMRAVVMSGTYERLWQRHLSHPPINNIYQGHIAQFSMRMTALSAAILRPQIPLMKRNVEEYRERYKWMQSCLSRCDHIRIPHVEEAAKLVSNTIQFEICNSPESAIQDAVKAIGETGIPLARFGPYDRNERCVWNWHYLPYGTAQTVPRCTNLLRNTCDLRLRRTMTEDNVKRIAQIIVESIEKANGT
jgi:perosamine synthetase